MTDLRYPIGHATYTAPASSEDRAGWIAEIAALPMALRAAVEGLTDLQLDTAYRPDGWTVRQVVHHVADSHLNSYVRFRWALTEERPRIKAYDERRWATLDDAQHGPVDLSLLLLDRLHARWCHLLRGLSHDDYQRSFVHPDGDVVISLEESLATYAWHGRHHVAHITELRARNGW